MNWDRWDRWVAGRRAHRAGRVRRRPLSPAAERTLRVIFMLLAGSIFIWAALLSFGALRARALAAGIIHGDLGLPVVDLTLSAHTLAGVWALTVKSITAVGIIGIRLDPEDRRAWAALLGGLAMDLSFQTYGYDNWIARLQAAVPVLALALAIWIFEIPGRGTRTGAAGEVGMVGDAGQPLPSPGHPGPTSPPRDPIRHPERQGDPVPGGVGRRLSHPNGSGPPGRATIRSQDPRPAAAAAGARPDGDLSRLTLAALLPEDDRKALWRVKDQPAERAERIIERRRLDPARAHEVLRRWRGPEPERAAADTAAVA